MPRRVWKEARKPKERRLSIRYREENADPRERCHCGRWPSLRSRDVSEDCVSSQFVCDGCGKQGPEVEDAWIDRSTARLVWDQAIRRERAIAKSYAEETA